MSFVVERLSCVICFYFLRMITYLKHLFKTEKSGQLKHSFKSIVLIIEPFTNSDFFMQTHCTINRTQDHF